MPYTYAFFLGNHPDLSASEVWRLLEQQNYQPELVTITDRILIATIATELPPLFIDQVGGIERIAQILTQSPALWSASEIWSTLFPTPPNKKVNLGISLSSIPNQFAKALGHELKEIAPVSLRFVSPTHRSGRLNAAQVHFNKLTQEPNAEVVIIKTDATYYLAKTNYIQDIVAYEQRDTQRPARDAKIGMLPPKLAQIMLNLATSNLPAPDPQQPYTIYDPFCGMGTILQEGWLRDYVMFGSDSNPDMIKASEQNLDWLTQYYDFVTPRPKVWQQDVQQPFPRDVHQTVDAIVAEPYLGRPLSQPLHPKEAPRHIEHLADLYLTFFQNANSVLKTHGYILLLLPAFRRGSRQNDTFTLFPTGFLDAVKEQGYSLEQLIPAALQPYFSPSDRGSLLYARPDALVGRELTLWKKR